MVTFMLNLPLSLAFKVKTFEGNFYHTVMSPGNQTEPTHIQNSLMFYKFTLPVPKQCKVTSPGLLVIMCVCVCVFKGAHGKTYDYRVTVHSSMNQGPRARKWIFKLRNCPWNLKNVTAI